MNTMQLICIGAVIGVGAMVCLAWLGYYLGKRKISLSGEFKKADKITACAVKVADIVGPALPAPFNVMVPAIAGGVSEAVNSSETLTLASNMPADQRKTVAMDKIVYDLEQAGLLKADDTATMAKAQNLIGAFIDMSVPLLPKTHTEAKAAPAVAQTAKAQ